MEDDVYAIPVRDEYSTTDGGRDRNYGLNRATNNGCGDYWGI